MIDIAPDIIAVQTAHRRRLAACYAGQPADVVPALRGTWAGYYGPPETAAFRRWTAEALPGIVARLVAGAGHAVTFHPLVVECNPLGVHFVDALFGARVYQTDTSTWSDPLPGCLADLAPLDPAALPAYRWTLEAIGALLALLPAPVAVTTPILSSPVNIAINLFGEAALMDLVDADPATRRGLQAIARTIRALHAGYRAHFPTPRVRPYCACDRYAPDGVGHLCGCSTQLVSGATYRDLFAPLDQYILEAYPGGGTLHLCGTHAQHLAAWAALPALRAVQLNDAAADDFPAYHAGLRDDQLIYITPTDAMPVARILAISGGRRVILQTELEAPVVPA